MRFLPEAVSHKETVPSRFPAARVIPSGDKASERVPPGRCSGSRFSLQSSSRPCDQTQTGRSRQVAARCSALAEIANDVTSAVRSKTVRAAGASAVAPLSVQTRGRITKTKMIASRNGEGRYNRRRGDWLMAGETPDEFVFAAFGGLASRGLIENRSMSLPFP